MPPDKLVFGGQGPLPMRFGSVGNPVSTGAARNLPVQSPVLNNKLVFGRLTGLSPCTPRLRGVVLRAANL